MNLQLSRQIAYLISIIRDADNNSGAGISKIVNEMNTIAPVLRDEMTKLLEALSKNAVTLQESTLKNFEAEVKRFIDVMNSSCKNLDNASQEQSTLLANVAGTVQNAMTSSARDIQSDFEKAHTSLQTMINDSMNQIKDDYQKNMRVMFQSMADNLAAIVQELRNANAGGN